MTWLRSLLRLLAGLARLEQRMTELEAAVAAIQATITDAVARIRVLEANQADPTAVAALTAALTAANEQLRTAITSV